MALADFGWDDHFAGLFKPYADEGLSPARVVKQLRDQSLVATEKGERKATVSGRFRHDVAESSAYPTVGDWMAGESSGPDAFLIHTVLPRRSAFVRKSAGEKTEAQVVAANIDTVFLVTGLDDNFNLRRIERYLTAAWDSGAFPVIVLNKSDLRKDLAQVKADTERIAVGAPVITLSAIEGSNLEALETWLEPRKTVALLGSSGVGKSTLINRLLGEERFATASVRESDSRGRHTTASRELVALPGGALLVDTPGMRELQLWTDEESLGRTFDDIERLAPECRFADCSHELEPGCAVLEAVEKGEIDPARLASYHKQRRELDHIATKQDERTRRQAEKAFGRRMATMIKEIKRHKPRYWD